ncbi:cytoplasmic polyadenylation element-binding protein 2-like [Sinocyclocheilus anshuiensis]|uniref:cytoplasmic polyadenylation element-binding protein 2-like n=1 Tax=Sinocyclocheilus anshuiensis TaxID=1608454 RepID=UPI0007BA2CC4|nr:PREDICTED: cytoplasmic polyadenylation element-binding protein 2-like [Sinocyclocheilus anshuiensis]
MGDYGFGLLQTANISSSSTRFGGYAFTPYPNASPVRPSSSPLVSPLFPSHQRNMQDEPAGLTASQSNSEQSSAADNDLSRFSAVGHAQTAGDLQRDRNIHQQTQPPPPQQQPYSSSSTGLDTDAPSSKVKTQMEFSPSLPAFGTPWSVQTSSPPPPVSNAANAINPIPTTEPDNFYPGIPSSINPGFFQSFSANPCPVQGFGSPFSPQINAPPQSRRSPVSPQIPPQQGAFLQQRNNYNHHHQPMMKQSPWGSHQGSGWTSGGVSWGRDHRRGGGMGVPGSVNQISPMKKPFSSNVIAPPKFPRSAGSLGPKSWIEENMFRTDNNSNTLLPLQDRSRMYDSLNMHSLESSLIDIMRAEQDPLKGRVGCPHPAADGLLMLNGNYNSELQICSSSCFSLSSLSDCHDLIFPTDEITSSFRRFGHLVVDWPHKAESKSYFPPKGYAFLLFQEESSVQALIEACLEEDGKLYLCVSSPTIKDKPVQIRPWNLNDSDFVMDGSQPLDPRKTIFVGGVPRPLRAVELAMIMDRLYGGVCYAGIDTDPELKYPKGAGRVAFSNQQSYIAAISARFVQLQHGDIDKRVEVKPYVLDDQLCDECQGARCGGKFAPFFCANVTCLQYYCEFCWANIHSRAGREFHKPLVKEGADRPRQIHFRWN